MFFGQHLSRPPTRVLLSQSLSGLICLSDNCYLAEKKEGVLLEATSSRDWSVHVVSGNECLYVYGLVLCMEVSKMLTPLMRVCGVEDKSGIKEEKAVVASSTMVYWGKIAPIFTYRAVHFGPFRKISSKEHQLSS